MKIPALDVKQNQDEEDNFCEICIQGKSKKLKFPKRSENPTNGTLELIHSGVAGPLKPETLGGARFFVSFIDDFSSFATVVPIERKSEVFENFKTFQHEAENQLDKRIKKLQTDNGGEYTSTAFKKHTEKCGIQHRFTAPNNPQQNGKAEKFNSTLLNSVRCMLLESGAPKAFWGEAIATATVIRNKCPSKSINFAIPEERWREQEISVTEWNSLKAFGCQAWAKVDPDDKLEARGEECVFLGYPKYSKS